MFLNEIQFFILVGVYSDKTHLGEFFGQAFQSFLVTSGARAFGRQKNDDCSFGILLWIQINPFIGDKVGSRQRFCGTGQSYGVKGA